MNHWPFKKGIFFYYSYARSRGHSLATKWFATTYWLLTGHCVGKAKVIFSPLWRPAVFLSSVIEWGGPRGAASQASGKSQGQLKEQEYMVLQQRSRQLCSNPPVFQWLLPLGVAYVCLLPFIPSLQHLRAGPGYPSEGTGLSSNCVYI